MPDILVCMDINDYLIAQAGKDWAKLLSGWRDALPEDFTLWMVNRFGDVFIVHDDGSVHMLDVGAGRIERVANSRDHFCTLIDAGENANNWLMIPLVDASVASGLVLRESQCYGYKVPPILGGKYEVSNVEPTDLSVHYAFLADIYRQTKDVPDGIAIRVVVTD
jgi:hypothetical protein